MRICFSTLILDQDQGVIFHAWLRTIPEVYKTNWFHDELSLYLRTEEDLLEFLPRVLKFLSGLKATFDFELQLTNQNF